MAAERGTREMERGEERERNGEGRERREADFVQGRSEASREKSLQNSNLKSDKCVSIKSFFDIRDTCLCKERERELF